MLAFDSSASLGRLKRSLNSPDPLIRRPCSSECDAAAGYGGVGPDDDEQYDVVPSKRQRDGTVDDAGLACGPLGAALASVPQFAQPSSSLLDQSDFWKTFDWQKVGGLSWQPSGAAEAPAAAGTSHTDEHRAGALPEEGGSLPEAPHAAICSNACDADVERVVSGGEGEEEAAAAPRANPNPASLLLLTQRLLKENMALRRQAQVQEQKISRIQHALEVSCVARAPGCGHCAA